MGNIMKRFAFFALILCLAGSVTACKPSKEKVQKSEYYQSLKKKYDKLKKEKKELQEQAKEKEEPSADEVRAKTYLSKIERDSIVKLEIGYHSNMKGSEFIEDPVAYDLATSIAKKADLTSKYTPEKLEKDFDCVYEYILYDEDNAVYEIKVFEGNYIIFSDLPNNVYYCYNASILGDAFLHYQNGYPNSTPFHRLADSALVVKSEKEYYDNRVAAKAGILINSMEKEKISEARVVENWKNAAKEADETYKRPKGKSYTFYHHANKMKLTLYDEYFSFRNMDGEVKWYKCDKESMDKLRDIFK